MSDNLSSKQELVRLPKITAKIIDDYRGRDIPLLEAVDGAAYSWTQEAVDFACLVKGEGYAEIERLKQKLAYADDAAAKGELARQNAGGMELQIEAQRDKIKELEEANTQLMQDLLKGSIRIAEAEKRLGEPPAVTLHHCNICGGEVDLSNATKPTEKVGRGAKFKQTDAPDDGAMRGAAVTKSAGCATHLPNQSPWCPICNPDKTVPALNRASAETPAPLCSRCLGVAKDDCYFPEDCTHFRPAESEEGNQP